MTNKPEGHRTSPPDFLTVEEAADVLSVGRTSAYRQARGYLATNGAAGSCADRLGKQIRTPRGHLEQRLGAPITWPMVPDEIAAEPAIASMTSAQTRKRASRRAARGHERPAYQSERSRDIAGGSSDLIVSLRGVTKSAFCTGVFGESDDEQA